MPPPRLDPTRIRAITLDLDDTLWPVWPTIERAEEALRTWLDAHAPRTATLARDAHATHAARQAVLHARPHIAHDLGAIRHAAIAHLLREAGDDQALADAAFAHFHAERQRVNLFDDALPALQWLATRYPVVALTNGNADVHRVGIGAHFHASINAAQAGVAKPDARIFHAGAQAAGVATHEVLHVGDDPHLDGTGAIAAGMQMAWLNRSAQPWPADAGAPPHVVVSDLAALCEHLHGARTPRAP
ncbi:MAG: HAD-IA family hydrolase [Pseudomonadota bacterium]|nr:HAD-IA family hydrolase [Pseudomonadota bacterium]